MPKSAPLGAIVAAVLALGQPPAGAIITDPDNPPSLPCFDSWYGTLTASPPVVDLNQSVTLSWNTNASLAGCAAPTNHQLVTRRGGQVISIEWVHGRTGSITKKVTGNTQWTLNSVWAPLVTKVTGAAWASVRLQDPEPGRPYYKILYDTQLADFLAAIQVRNATIVLGDELNLNLSGQNELFIAPGVHIIGRRSPTNPGPRLYTTTRPAVLFHIGDRLDGSDDRKPADNVRIIGVRLDGGNLGIADADDDSPKGLDIVSSINVEIAHCELYGWGIAVYAIDKLGRVNLDNATSVWIHDNYIHHNRHYEENGYGVESKAGYVLIEKNVFDYNRHAIAAGSDEGTGYLAYHNLVLENGGEGFNTGVAYWNTHMFDVHGAEDCIWDQYCGRAGEFFDYRHNTFYYDAGVAIKLRGEPTIGAEATRNVFDDSDAWESVTGGDGAFAQTEGNNFDVWNNQFNVDALADDPALTCDFDGDGTRDRFLATGATWWFKSAIDQWFYLNTSPKRVGELTLADFDGDGRCDVRVNSDGKIWSGGKKRPLERTDLLWTADEQEAFRVWKMSQTGARADDDLWLIAPEGARVLGGGDFNGDGAADVAWRYGNEINVTLISPEQDSVRFAIGRRPEKQGTVATDTQLAGIGDFNGDARSDLLWLHDNRTLEIWFAGEAGNSAKPTWSNGLPAEDEPVEPVGLGWEVKSVADFNGDGYSDILWWHEASRKMDIWYMRHAVRIGNAYTGGLVIANDWRIQAAGDLDGDGRADLLWRADAGAWLSLWFAGRYEVGQAGPSWQNNGYASGLDWKVKGLGDFNGDGRADIVWRHDNGATGVWFMNGGVWIGASEAVPMDPSWKIAGYLPAAAPRMDSSQP